MSNPPRRTKVDPPLPQPAPELAKREVPVRAVMTPRVRTIGRRDSARHAANLMRDWCIQHLVVVDAAGRVCGVVSDRDIRAASPSSAEAQPGLDPLTKLHVADLMAANPITVRPADDVTFALQKMRTHKVGCLAVVDELGSAVGIITGYDVVTLALQLFAVARAKL